MVISVTCAICSSQFAVDTATYQTLGIAAIPRRCPTCADRHQARPERAVVLSRTCLGEWGGVLIHLPGVEWLPFCAQEGDKPCRRAILRVHDGCVSRGRMDVYVLGHSPHREVDALFRGRAPLPKPVDAAMSHPVVPTVARVRLMEATHAASPGALEERQAGGWTGPAVTLPRVEFSPTWRYVVIEPSPETVATSALVFPAARSKSTLKGFGRQYWTGLHTEDALAVLSDFYSTGRTGRFRTEAVLALVDDQHPVLMDFRERGQRSVTRYDLSAPGGREIEALSPLAPEEEVSLSAP